MMGVKQIKTVRMLRQEGQPIKEISRRTGISRNTIRKILRGQAAKFTWEATARKTLDFYDRVLGRGPA